MLEPGQVGRLPQPTHRPAVGGMVIAVDDNLRGAPGATLLQHGHEEFKDAFLDSLGVGTAEVCLEPFSADPLFGCHGPLAAERTVGEVTDEPAVGIDGEIAVEGIVLGELEGLEAIDDDGVRDRMACEHPTVVDQAVAASPGDVAHDGCMGDTEEAGDLAQAGALGREADDIEVHIAAPEPVVGLEGPCGESASAVSAPEALDETTVGTTTEGAVACRSPLGIGRVVGAVGVRAMRRTEAIMAPSYG